MKSIKINKTVTASLLIVALTISMTTETKTKTNVIIDATHPTEYNLPNVASNINIWELGQSFVKPSIEFPEYNEFRFIKWVQLMNCSGGSESRDLFKNPNDRNNLDDYDFDLLIKNCEGILQLGAKPYLKLGAVPLKLTTAPKLNGFGYNMYPPDSYEEYYNYIKALLSALVECFGKDEVLSWRFGCMVEYENGAHFKARSETPEDSFIEYCKMFDYTVQALIDVLGEDVFVGAHSMSVLDGLWDERDFIEHVAHGRNYANGGIGTKISSLSVSFYENAPGKLSFKTLSNTILPLQDKARECGLTDLIYGVDEGRVLAGTKGAKTANLNSRASGFTWQAAEDARLYSQAIDLGMEYFSAWNYLTAGNLAGYPTISFHVASNMASFDGYKRIAVNNPLKKNKRMEVGCLAGVKKDTVRIMLYNFSPDINACDIEDVSLDIILPFKKRKAKIVKWTINDDCNFFDDWLIDRKEYGISDDNFQLSPDDGEVEAVLYDSKAKDIYKRHLRSKYISKSTLSADTTYVKIKDGHYSESITIASHNVLFFQITKR